MLKIKDNVDLKELEKFGLTKGGYTDYLRYMFSNKQTHEEKLSDSFIQKENTYCYYYELVIDVTTRNISITIYDTDDDTMSHDILFDLIQAGLVEKVEEE